MRIFDLYNTYLGSKKISPDSGFLRFLSYDTGWAYANRGCMRSFNDIYTQGGQKGNYKYQGYVGLSYDRGQNWSVSTSIPQIGSLSGNPTNVACVKDGSGNDIIVVSTDEDGVFFYDKTFTSCIGSYIDNISWLHDMLWTWDPSKSSEGSLFLDNSQHKVSYIDTSTYTGSIIYTGQGKYTKPCCRYADIQSPKYYYINDSVLYECSTPNGTYTQSSLQMPTLDDTFKGMVAFKGRLLLTFTDKILILDNDVWQDVNLNGFVFDSNTYYSYDLNHNDDIFAILVDYYAYCKFLYTSDGFNWFLLDVTNQVPTMSPRMSSEGMSPCINCGKIYDRNKVDFCITNSRGDRLSYENFIVHTKIIEEFKGLKFKATQDNSSVGYTIIGTPTGSDIKYSYDGENWNSWDGTSISLNTNDCIYVKGNNPNGLNTDSINNRLSFTMSGKISASGNINSLLDDSDGFDLTNNTLPGNYCYGHLFYECSSLVTPPDLPATGLTTGCYYRMFQNCTSLVSAPELPAITLASHCYLTMFRGCSSLVTASNLSATTLPERCYSYMYADCTSLVDAPQMLGTTLGTRCCERMFYNCSSLVNAPTLPATSLATNCYSYMFTNCASLVDAPELPATTLSNSCYEGMFFNCTSLLVAPTLPATTLAYSCYDQMFRGCSTLSYIKLDYSGDFSNTTYFTNWVKDVSSSGYFYYNGTDTSNFGDSAIPNNWTIKSLNYLTCSFVGSPTIKNGIISDMNSSNYIRYSSADILSSNSWEVCLRVHWNGTTNGAVFLRVADGASFFRIETNGGFSFNGYLSNNAQVLVHSTDFPKNKEGWYYIKLKFIIETGTFEIYHGTTLNNITRSRSVEKGEGAYLRYLTSSRYIYSPYGEIDLKTSYVIVNNTEYQLKYRS